MLYLAAYTYGDIVGKRVLDLGCGTGRLALAAAFMGAQSVVGVDIDKTAVRMAFENLAQTDLKAKVDLVVGDIDTVKGSFDTVLQNPPFGVQMRAADRRFLSRALEVGKVAYSLHNHPCTDKQLMRRLKTNAGGFLQVAASPFIQRFVEEHGGKVEAVYALALVIPYMFEFHTKAKHDVIVDFYVIRRNE
jgi:putative methylase